MEKIKSFPVKAGSGHVNLSVYDVSGDEDVDTLSRVRS